MDAPADLPALLAELDRIREDIAFVRALRQLKVITTDAPISLQFSLGSENAVLDLRSLTASGEPLPGQIPAQAGHSGEVLTTDGATASWLSL